jgi:hypothetical protein
MRNFGIPESQVQNKDVFIKALCTQFQNIVSEVSNEVNDIVASEYNRLLRESGAETVNDSPFYPGDELLLVGELPAQSHEVIFYEKFEHQWTIKNTGTVTWEDRYLECTNQSETRIRALNKTVIIPKVKPGEDVCLTARFDARGFEGKFESIWEMKDNVGRPCFTDNSKALKFEVIVVNEHKVSLGA